jgi:RNA polymerase sigma-70 factor (ECF subfamily)
MSTPSTFEEIYSANYKAMYRVAFKMIGDKDGASDIVQEVFIACFQRLRNGLVLDNTKSWLYKVTYIKCMDHFRKQKRLNEIELMDDIEIEDKQNDKHEMKIVIIQALSKLNPQEKAIAVLYSEGLSYKEMASATGINFSSIGKTLSRTLIKLEQELKKLRYEMY